MCGNRRHHPGQCNNHRGDERTAPQGAGYFNAHKALSPDRAIARDALEPALHATLEQLRAQGIIKDSGDALSYLDADALLAYEKKMAKSGRIAVMAMVPVLVAVVVAIVVAITLSR